MSNKLVVNNVPPPLISPPSGWVYDLSLQQVVKTGEEMHFLSRHTIYVRKVVLQAPF